MLPHVGQLFSVVKLLKSRWWNATFLPLPFLPFLNPLLSFPLPSLPFLPFLNPLLSFPLPSLTYPLLPFPLEVGRPLPASGSGQAL